MAVEPGQLGVAKDAEAVPHVQAAFDEEADGLGGPAPFADEDEDRNDLAEPLNRRSQRWSRRRLFLRGWIVEQ